MKWIKTLKFRLIMAMMAVVMITIFIIAVAIVSNQRQAIEQQTRQELISLGDLLKTNTLSSLLFDDAESARQTLSSLTVQPDIIQASIFDDNAQQFAHYRRQSQPESVAPRLIRNVLEQQKPSMYEDKDGLHLLMPMESHGEQVGVLYLVDDRASFKSQLRSFYRVVMITALIAFFASLIATLWLVSMFMTPVTELLTTIRQISKHRDYRRRTPQASTVEFTQLSDSFNQMISEIETRDQQLEQVNAELEQRVQARTEALETALDLANDANKAKAEFLAVMSHEVRTPLNGVIGFAELLKMQKLDDEAEETVSLLNESAVTLLDLLNQILDFSKLEADKVELEQQRIEITSFIKSVVETNRAKADRKGLALELQLNACDGYFVGDGLRLRQILNNLVDNAIKFTGQGKVQVAVNSEQSQGQSWLSFEVKDSGSGITPSKLRTVFSPFAQADSSITRKYGGTGLGLAICAQLIKLMKGRYGVESEEHQGSLFWFKIPVEWVETVVEPVIQPSIPTASASSKGRRILLAEDNEINQTVAKGMLDKLGYDVDIVMNGSEAVSHCMQQKYDLILMDYHMPQMSGIDATRLIRDSGEHGLNSQTPIIALTADVQSKVANEFRRAGADDLMTKPFKFERLRKLIETYLDKETTSKTEDNVIDESVLAEIREMSGEQGNRLIHNIFELYLQKTPSLIDDIHHGTDVGDADKVFRAAHALKSSSANIGAVRVSAIAQELEMLGRENLIEQAHPYLDKLMESYEQASASLRGRLGEV